MRVSKPPAQRRAELVAAARRLFDKNGVQNTRVSDIVADVGVAQGVFYYYFPSKDAMVAEVVAEVTAETGAAADAILADDGADFPQKLAAFIGLYIHLVDQFLPDDATHLPQAAESLESGTLIAHCWQELTGRLLALVRAGAAAGDIQVAWPEQQARVLLWGLWKLAAEAMPTKTQIAAIVAQGLGLDPAELERNIHTDEENGNEPTQ